MPASLSSHDPRASLPRDNPIIPLGKHPFSSIELRSLNLLMDSLSVYSGKYLVLHHHEGPLPFPYIPLPSPSSHHHLEKHFGQEAFTELCRSLRGSKQLLPAPAHLTSGQQDNHQGITDTPAIHAASRYNTIFSQGSFILTSCLVVMADRQQPEARGRAAPRENPLDRVLGNDSCTLCKDHCFLIARFMKHHNELREDFIADSRSKRKKLEKRKKEIESLKDRCEHLEEAIKHIQSITESMQAEASTKDSQKEQQKEDHMEETVNQFWC